MTEPITIPDDIAEALGELTEKQQGVLSRLLQTMGEERTRELLATAQVRLAQLQAGNPPPNAPRTVRAMLWTMLFEFALPLRTSILGLPTPTRTKPANGYQRWQMICQRLGEANPHAQYTIRAIIDRLGFDQVEAVVAEAEQMEAQGGMLVPDGSRRRTLGGVFFYLLKQQLTPEELHRFFPSTRKQPSTSTTTAPAAPAEPALPERPAFVWAERKGLYQELGAGGAGSVKVTLIGRPGKVIEKQDVVITSITVDKKPALPKGVPAPLPTTYSVYIGRKQWAKVAEAIQNPEDILIIEGVACYDPAMEGIMVSAANITTKLLQQAKKQSPAPATGAVHGRADDGPRHGQGAPTAPQQPGGSAAAAQVPDYWLPTPWVVYVRDGVMQPVPFPDAVAVVLPIHTAYSGPDGGYVAVYTRDPQVAIYTVGGGIFVAGLIRVRGTYIGRIFHPTGYAAGADITQDPALHALRAQYFPQVVDGWFGGDTGGWFGLRSS